MYKKIFNFKLDYPNFEHKVNKYTKIDRTGRYDSRINQEDINRAKKKLNFYNFIAII